jgi:gamma-glutamylcyclotransferase (GGCT)/AIG2-like uncharacterized protein YtfP
MNQPIQTSSLFVYGTLLNPSVRAQLLGRTIGAIPARLSGYARGQRRYFFVVEREDAETEGVVLTELTVRDFEVLDEYEEVPALYTRERITVSDGSGMRLECWIYLPTDWAR